MPYYFPSYPCSPFPLLTPGTYRSVEVVAEQPISYRMWLCSIAKKQKLNQIENIIL